MNEATGQAASSLAITEKRAHRPGGCVGIFFQLFDWNRKLAKKKLFSKKLLPPARAKQAAKKFGGDEKMPRTKLHLIADENNGGFPNVKKNGNRSVDNMVQKHEMRAPSLVARLMGLESMPAVQRDKLKKASANENCESREHKFVDSHSGFDREDVNLEKGSAKTDSRPQKLQKTGPSERRVVTRFGAEALHIKGVLSRSRKHHHTKLASPVKSPRISSAKSASRTSRLIDAATRILEPGLQASSRAKCALTYLTPMHYLPNDEVMTERMGVMSPDLSKKTRYDVDIGGSLMGQTSCKNCGNLFDVEDSNANMEEQQFASLSASSMIHASSEELGMSIPRPPVSLLDQERDVDYQTSPNRPGQLTAQEQKHIRGCSDEYVMDQRPPSQETEVQARWHLKSQQRKPQNEESLSTAFTQRSPAQNQMPLGRDRIPPRAKLNNLQSRRVPSTANAAVGAKDFVSLNRSLSGRTRPRMPGKVDNSSLDNDRKFCSQKDDSLSHFRTPIRKKRIIGVNGQIESSGFVNSTAPKQRSSGRCDIATGNEMQINAHAFDRTCIKSRNSCQGEGSRSNSNKNSGVVSFTFNSPVRHRPPLSAETKEKRKYRKISNDNGVSHQRKPLFDEHDQKTSLEKQLQIKADSLGALLEQKLKELTYQEEDDSTTGGAQPKKSAAVILQELISALTAEEPISQDVHIPSSQAGPKIEGITLGFARDADHFSPGSVLEASFSNDSCFSSSLDDSSGCRMHLESMDYSYDELQPSEPDTDLLDSATSLKSGRSGYRIVNGLVNHISRMLHCINLSGIGLTESKLTHAKEVVLNAELLFGSATGSRKDLIIPSLIDKFEALAGAMCTNFNYLLDLVETKESNKLRGFLFDCVIEYLDSKYGQIWNSGYKAWRRLPSCLNAEILTRKAGNEVSRWSHFVGMVPDEIIEWEMSHSLGKWTDFDVEAFETGHQIGMDILQNLVEEAVIDLLECWLMSF